MNDFLTSTFDLDLVLFLSSEAVFLDTSIAADTTIIELEKHYDTRKQLEKAINARIELAPIKTECIESIIKEYEDYFETYLFTYISKEPNEYNSQIPLPMKEWPADYLAYQCIKRGLNAQVFNFCHELVYRTANGHMRLEPMVKNILRKIAEGVTVAYTLPKLREALNLYKEEKLTETISSNEGKKLKWTGTPAQFGFIFELLIQGGYLEKPTGSYEKDALFYLEHFDIDTTKGTLAKELSEKTNSIESKYRNNLKIPPKDKLSKPESSPKVAGK